MTVTSPRAVASFQRRPRTHLSNMRNLRFVMECSLRLQLRGHPALGGLQKGDGQRAVMDAEAAVVGNQIEIEACLLDVGRNVLLLALNRTVTRAVRARKLACVFVFPRQGAVGADGRGRFRRAPLIQSSLHVLTQRGDDSLEEFGEAFGIVPTAVTTGAGLMGIKGKFVSGFSGRSLHVAAGTLFLDEKVRSGELRERSVCHFPHGA